MVLSGGSGALAYAVIPIKTDKITGRVFFIGNPMCEDTGLSENKDGALMLHKDTFSIQIVLNCMLERLFADILPPFTASRTALFGEIFFGNVKISG